MSRGSELLKSLRAAWLLLVPAAVRANLPRAAVLGAAFGLGAAAVATAHRRLRPSERAAVPVQERALVEPKDAPESAPQAPGPSLTLPLPYGHEWGSAEWRTFCARPGTRCATLLHPDGGVIAWGETDANTLPVRDAAQEEPGGMTDAFLALFAADNRLIFATYFGGTMNELAADAGVDDQGNIWLAGRTGSRDLPTRSAPRPESGGGLDDGFLAKYDPRGRQVLATYHGGRYDEQGSREVLERPAP